MRIVLLPVMMISVALGVAACKSHEHPKEHPTKEHPENPSGMKFNLKKEYTVAVQDHIRNAVKQSGSFNVSDAKAGVQRKLSLVRIHSEKIVRLGNERYFACADFKEGGTGKIIDLDFYASREGSSWKIEPALIHKVAGKPRFTYNQDNERVTVN